MIDDRNFEERSEVKNKEKQKQFWKSFGIGALAFVLAVFTILVVSVSL